MAQVLLDRGERYARHHQLAGEAMARVVQADGRQASLAGGTVEGVLDDVAAEVGAVLSAEHQRPPQMPVIPERIHQLGAHGDASPAVALGAVQLAVGPVPDHPKLALHEVQVVPAQGEQLTEPHARAQRAQEEGVVGRIDLQQGVQECVGLLAVPEAELLGREPEQAHARDGVALAVAPVHGLAEDHGQHPEVVVDRLGRQRPAPALLARASAGGELGGLVLLHLLGLDVAQILVTEERDQVDTDDLLRRAVVRVLAVRLQVGVEPLLREAAERGELHDRRRGRGDLATPEQLQLLGLLLGGPATSHAAESHGLAGHGVVVAKVDEVHAVPLPDGHGRPPSSPPRRSAAATLSPRTWRIEPSGAPA